jgi:hypothetical protein
LSTARPFSTTKRTIDIIGRRKRMFKINHKLYIQGRIRGNFKEEVNSKKEEGDDDDDV